MLLFVVLFLILVLLILLVLDRNIRLYPPVKVIGKSFIGVKRVTVPNQSLSLREIIRRFVRRESLPVSKEGIYEERFGDLEKISHEDITVQMDRVEDLKVKLAAMQKRIDAKNAADAKAANDALAKQKLVDEFLARPTPSPTSPPVPGIS